MNSISYDFFKYLFMRLAKGEKNHYDCTLTWHKLNRTSIHVIIYNI